jgi:hypothetical protein
MRSEVLSKAVVLSDDESVAQPSSMQKSPIVKWMIAWEDELISSDCFLNLTFFSPVAADFALRLGPDDERSG